MPQSQSAESVQELILSLMNELSVDQTAPVAESILLRNGYLAGKRYQRGGVRIHWFFEEGELKVYNADGKLVKVVALAERRRQAA